ncbi:hypothetical protein CERSUDRAFT_95924 [Gelatoporia subvermispora B]|uniref:Uncharacterized protein n=1 Tax=Ceriporiopsis subvermispora (strain B) TaxID=914234 RepID=M2QHW8_CERS8|nr:hypothetical protein CERSUDRAFT_95924 [Gelatoporia subvermispora B]
MHARFLHASSSLSQRLPHRGPPHPHPVLRFSRLSLVFSSSSTPAPAPGQPHQALAQDRAQISSSRLTPPSAAYTSLPATPQPPRASGTSPPHTTHVAPSLCLALLIFATKDSARRRCRVSEAPTQRFSTPSRLSPPNAACKRVPPARLCLLQPASAAIDDNARRLWKPPRLFARLSRRGTAQCLVLRTNSAAHSLGGPQSSTQQSLVILAHLVCTAPV